MKGIAWRWQGIDGAMFKAPMGQEPVGPNPTDRGKNGSKCHLLVDGRGVPLLIVVTSAYVNDGKRGWSRSSRRSRSSSAASTCVPTLAIAAPSCCESSHGTTVISPRRGPAPGVHSKATTAGHERHAAGSLRYAAVDPTASASRWSDTRSCWRAASLH